MAEDKNQTHYFLDGNPEELERLRLGQAVITSCFGKPVFAPVQFLEPHLRVLDSATADGLWLQELRDAIPAPMKETHVFIGTDITNKYFQQPPPDGIQFYEQSMTKPWPVEWKESFDLVHQRMALPAAGKAAVHDALDALVDLVKPGGWIQLVEPDHSASKSPSMQDFFRLLSDIFVYMETSTEYAPKLKTWLLDRGLENVEERVFEVPIGRTSLTEDLRVKSSRMIELVTKGLVEVAEKIPTSFSTEELRNLTAKAVKDINESGDILRLHCVWARKPSGNEGAPGSDN